MPSPKNISAIMANRRIVETAMRRGVRDALVRHIQAGLPAVAWRDGKTVWVYPAELRRIVRKMNAELGRRKANRRRRA